MLVYNIFFMLKKDNLNISECSEQIKTFRLKYVFVAAKIIKTEEKVLELHDQNSLEMIKMKIII